MKELIEGYISKLKDGGKFNMQINNSCLNTANGSKVEPNGAEDHIKFVQKFSIMAVSIWYDIKTHQSHITNDFKVTIFPILPKEAIAKNFDKKFWTIDKFLGLIQDEEYNPYLHTYEW